MAFRLSVAHLKGGVGKSTTTVFLAEMLAVNYDLRVLVVDLDPQANSSFMLLSRAGVEDAERQGKLLPKFLIDLYESPRPQLNIADYIITGASDLEELQTRSAKGRVDVLASLPMLWFVDNALEKRACSENVDAGEMLKSALGQHLAQVEPFYDLIIFDCPPGFTALTRAGLLSVEAVLSPTIADSVSGRSLNDFVQIGLQRLTNGQAPAHYVAISKYVRNSTDRREVDWLRRSYDVLDPPIRFSVAMTRAMERLRPDSYRSVRE